VDSTSDEGRAAGLRGAVELYRGAYLEGVYADWCVERRRILEARYLLALAVLLQHAARSGNYHQGLQYAQSILALDPYQEDAHRYTIELHGRLGDRAGGMRHFQRYAELVRDELGDEPAPQVEAAYRALLRDSRALA
jgi:DNA-binding SARP family transcriptional activator